MLHVACLLRKRAKHYRDLARLTSNREVSNLLIAAAISDEEEAAKLDAESVSNVEDWRMSNDGDWRMSNVEDWRMKAEELRTIADGMMMSDHTRHLLRNAAANYDRLADETEDRDKPDASPSRPKTG